MESKVPQAHRDLLDYREYKARLVFKAQKVFRAK
jgi:hypothetical protein